MVARKPLKPLPSASIYTGRWHAVRAAVIQILHECCNTGFANSSPNAFALRYSSPSHGQLERRYTTHRNIGDGKAFWLLLLIS